MTDCKPDISRPRNCATHDLLPIYPSRDKCLIGITQDNLGTGNDNKMAPTTLTRLARRHLENAYNLIQSPLTIAEGEANLIEAQKKINMAIKILRKDE